MLDSAVRIDEVMEGKGMAKFRFPSIFGPGKADEDSFKMSKTLFDSVKKFASLDEEGKKKEIESVMLHVSRLGDSEQKEALVGFITDSYKSPVEVLAKAGEAEKIIDGLYSQCRAADEERAKKLLDSVLEQKKDDKDKGNDNDGKDNKDDKDKDKDDKHVMKDTAALIDETVKKAVGAMNDSIKTLVDESVKKALGLEQDKSDRTKGSGGTLTDSLDESDLHELTRGIFVH